MATLNAEQLMLLAMMHPGIYIRANGQHWTTKHEDDHAFPHVILRGVGWMIDPSAYEPMLFPEDYDECRKALQRLLDTHGGKP